MMTFTVRPFLIPSAIQSLLFMMEDAVAFTAKIFYGPSRMQLSLFVVELSLVLYLMESSDLPKTKFYSR
jgi:hypothetical protein